MQIASLQNSVSAEEWKLRCDLAACYRLVAAYGWSDLIFTHISARLPGADHRFLINPYGMLFEEITASSLIAIDQDGNKLHDSAFPVNRAGFVIHSAIHAGRDDAQCVLHTHTRTGVAVSAQKEGDLGHAIPPASNLRMGADLGSIWRGAQIATARAELHRRLPKELRPERFFHCPRCGPGYKCPSKRARQ